jgi:hypothetical protein
VAKLPDGIPVIARQIGHKSMSVSVYSHPRLGVAAQLCWGVWKGSENVRSIPQIQYARDNSLANWEDALAVLEQCVLAARRQLQMLDALDE